MEGAVLVVGVNAYICCRDGAACPLQHFFVFGVLQFEDEIARLPQGIAAFVKMIAASSFSIYLYNYVFYAGRPGPRNGWVLLCYLGMVFGFGMIMHTLVERPLNDLVKKLLAKLK